jgi:hypothetical protein
MCEHSHNVHVESVLGETVLIAVIRDTSLPDLFDMCAS